VDLEGEGWGRRHGRAEARVRFLEVKGKVRGGRKKGPRGRG
jgi:hypothetical protein